MANLPAAFREYKRLERLRDAQGLSLEELERWTQLKRMLTEHFRPGAGHAADKQASLRVPIRLRVDFASQGALRECRMTNISRGGVFIATDKPLPIGTELELRVHVGEKGQAVDLRGEVASINTGAGLTRAENGMGIRFAGLSDKGAAFVRDLYGRAMEEAEVGDR